MIEAAEYSTLMKGGYVTDSYAEWFAKRLNKALELGSMKQAGLLTILKENGFEIQQQRLSHYFNGRNYPDPPVLKELARGLGVSADWLLGLTEQSLPAADLDEMAAQSRGEAKINKMMKKLPQEKQQQVLQFAEYLLYQAGINRENVPTIHPIPLSEEQRLNLAAERILDLVEENHGLPARKRIERQIREQFSDDDSAA